MQRWAGRPIWLRSAEASVERWTPPFCGIRTSVVCWLGNQSVGSPVPRQKKRAGDVLGCSLLQPLWDRHWGGPCVCVCVVHASAHTGVAQLEATVCSTAQQTVEPRINQVSPNMNGWLVHMEGSGRGGGV